MACMLELCHGPDILKLMIIENCVKDSSSSQNCLLMTEEVGFSDTLGNGQKVSLQANCFLLCHSNQLNFTTDRDIGT